MTLLRKLYAPPRTAADPPVGAPVPAARVLVPVCLLLALADLGSDLVYLGAFGLRRALEDGHEKVSSLAGIATGAGAVGALIAMFSGDRGAARHVMWLGLGLLACWGGVLAVSPNPWLAMVMPGVGALVGMCIMLVAMGYALRAVAPRHGYLVVALLYGSWFVSWLVQHGLRALVDEPTTHIWAGVACCGMAIIAALALPDPRCERPSSAIDSETSARPTRAAAIRVVLLMAVFGALGFVRYLSPTAETLVYNLDSRFFEMRRLVRMVIGGSPTVVCFGVLMLAAWRSWRPSIVAIAGIALFATGAAMLSILPRPDFAAAPSVVWGGHLLAHGAVRLGEVALFGAASWVLLRQLVSRTRLVFWAALYFATERLIWALPMFVVPLPQSDSGRRLTALAVVLLCLLIGVALTNALRRYRFLPLHSER